MRGVGDRGDGERNGLRRRVGIGSTLLIMRGHGERDTVGARSGHQREPDEVGWRQSPGVGDAVIAAVIERGVAGHAGNSHRQQCIRIDIGGADVQRDRIVLVNMQRIAR